MRDVDQLIESAMATIHWGFCHAPHGVLSPLFSGGHDSMCAVHLASQHDRFTGDVHHIDTGIGARYTRRFVESVAERFRWRLIVHKSQETYEKFVMDRGFPGPAMHGFAYNRLKDRCVRKIAKGSLPRLLITGCRAQESVRRMGHVAPVQMGELKVDKKTGRKSRVNLSRIWTAPCHDWSKAEQQSYMDEFGLPTNKLKVAVGISGECFCGAFAQPGERELIREHAPDVESEIVRLTAVARDCGKHCEWGTRPQRGGTIVVSPTGPLCSSCDQRAAACGIQMVERVD